MTAGTLHLRALAGAFVGVALLAAACSPGNFTEHRVTLVDSPDCADANPSRLRTGGTQVVAGDVEVALMIEVAYEGEARARGLMCRAEVPPDTGMMFKLPAESESGFWMFNTYVPLDLLYLDEKGRVMHAVTMLPCIRGPGEGDAAWEARCREEAAPHAPPEPYLWVLELTAGWLAAHGLELKALPAGTRVLLPSRSGLSSR